MRIARQPSVASSASDDVWTDQTSRGLAKSQRRGAELDGLELYGAKETSVAVARPPGTEVSTSISTLPAAHRFMENREAFSQLPLGSFRASNLDTRKEAN